MRRILTISTFAQKLGYSDASSKEFHQRLKLLERSGVVKVQQSGFSSHSLAHPKIVVMAEDLESLEKFSLDGKNCEEQTCYCCPYCGRVVNVFENLKRIWRFGSMHKILLGCPACSGRFQINVDKGIDKGVIAQLKTVQRFRTRR